MINAMIEANWNTEQIYLADHIISEKRLRLAPPLRKKKYW